MKSNKSKKKVYEWYFTIGEWYCYKIKMAIIISKKLNCILL